MVDLLEKEKKSLGGLGLASLDPGGLELNQSATSLLERPKVQPKAEKPVTTPPQQRIPGTGSFGQRFEDNPFAALGLLFSSISAGIRGLPSPVLAEQEKFARQRQANAGMFDAVSGIIADAAEILPTLPADKADEARVNYAQVLTSMTGSEDYAQDLIDTFLSSPEGLGKAVRLQGMGEALDFLGFPEMSELEQRDLVQSPEGLETVVAVNDRINKPMAVSKLREFMGRFDKIRESEAFKQNPDQFRVVTDAFDARGDFVGTQDELFIALEASGAFSAGELAALRNDPEATESISGSKSQATLLKEQQTAAGDAPTNFLQTLNEFEEAVEESGADSFRAQAMKAKIEKDIAPEGFILQTNADGTFTLTQGRPDALTQGAESGLEVDLIKKEKQAASIFDLTARTRELLADDSSKAIVGFVGGTVKFVDTVFAQFEGAGQLFGDDITPDVVKDLEDQGLFGKFANKSAKLKTNMIRLTSIMAVMNNDGSRPSDFDQKRADLMASLTSGSPAQINASISEFELQTIEAVEREHNAQQRRKPKGERVTFDRNQFFKDFKITPPPGLGALPTVTTKKQWNALPSGTEYLDKNGNKAVKQ